MIRATLLTSLLVVLSSFVAPTVATAGDTFPVIQPGNEDDILEAIEPLEMEGPVEAGYTLDSIAIEQRVVRFRLSPSDEDVWVEVVAYHKDDPELPAGSRLAGNIALLVIHSEGVDAVLADKVSAPLTKRLEANAQDLSSLWDAEALDEQDLPPTAPTNPGWGGLMSAEDLDQKPLVRLLSARNILFGVGLLFLLLVVLSGLPAFLRRKKA